MNRRQTLILVAIGLIWGSTWIAAGVLGEQVPPLLAASLRFLLSAACCAPFLWAQRLPMPSLRVLGALFLVSATMIVLPLLLLVWARYQLSSATVAVLFAATPLTAILLSPLFGEADAPRRAMPASIVGVAGMLIAMGAAFSGPQAGAAAVVFLAVLSTAFSSLWVRRALLHVKPVMLTAWVLGLGGVLLGLASLVWERGQPVHWDLHALLSLCLLAAIGGALAYSAWFWLLQRLQAYQVATVQWIEPLVALAESALLLRMGWSWAMISGTVITLGSMWVIAGARKEDDENVSFSGHLVRETIKNKPQM